MRMAKIGLWIALGILPALSQAQGNIRFSKPALLVARSLNDSVQILNDSPTRTRIDSIEVWQEGTRPYGAFLMTLDTAQGKPLYLVNMPVWTSPIRTRGGFSYAGAFRFPAGPLAMAGRGRFLAHGAMFDGCPACKVSADPAFRDTVELKLVFRQGNLGDTLNVFIDSLATLGLRPVKPRPSASAPVPGFDGLGRKLERSPRFSRASFFREPR